MREKINRLAKGIVDLEQVTVLVTPDHLNGKILAGKKTTGELFVSEKHGGYVKGLTYSSNARVHILKEVFGGVRNSIAYEVDSSWLSLGDEISGRIHLVTNGGEIDVPFCFQVTLGQSGNLIHGLKTAEDFAEIARKDTETALRLVGFENFTDAPFLQDPWRRALYDGIKGHPDRRNSLEEFLVALGVKKPVELLLDTKTRRYRAPEVLSQDSLTINLSTWGYVRFQVTADGEFLQLPKSSFGPEDAVDGVCEVVFHIDPEKLHGGNNLGAIRIDTVRESRVMCIEVRKDGKKQEEEEFVKEDLAKYFSLRLEYETAKEKDQLLLGQMKQEIGRLKNQYGETLQNTILEAEWFLLNGNREPAEKLLEKHRGQMAENRRSKYVEYCYYMYLQMLASGHEEQKTALLHLIKRRMEEEDPSGALLFLWVKLQPELLDAPETLLDTMQRYFKSGCHSPFLYLLALNLYQQNPEFLVRIGEFELQVLYFGARKSLIERTLALQAAELAVGRKQFHKLTYQLLSLLYNRFRENAFLTAICVILMKGDCRKTNFFHWYEEALKKEISLTGLYEYYLYALPRDYEKLLPKEVLLYFSYVNNLDDQNKAKLYTNILKYMKKDSTIYQQYEREIEKFAMEQLLKSRINRRLVVLYQHMLFKDMVDQQVAAVLPSILRSYRIRVKNPNVKYVIVCYEELKDEDAFPIEDGVAYVPLFLNQSVLLFQDKYGNRYSNIAYEKVSVMEKTDVADLLERCYDVFPAHPMLRLQECDDILKNGITSEKEATLVRKVAADMPLHPVFKKRILSAMIAYHMELLKKPERAGRADAGYLLGINMDRVSRKERNAICEALIGQCYYREVWNLVDRYGPEGIAPEKLYSVCSEQILQTCTDSEYLPYITGKLFEMGLYDSVILDYLCEHYNGSGETMYQLLKAGREARVELYDLAERLMAQMMFTGAVEKLDDVFEWFVAGHPSGESLIRAYFTIKSGQYFLKELPVKDKVFAYLEGILQKAVDLKRMPTLYLLSLCKYYAELDRLDEARTILCEKILAVLLAEDRIFAWFKDLEQKVSLPETVMDKTMFEYRSRFAEKNSQKPQLMVRILPEETEYRPQEIKRVYPGIYTVREVLFAGETLEYRITESDGKKDVVTAEGSIKPEIRKPSGGYSRYEALNELCNGINEKDESILKQKMLDYLTKNAAMEELFPSM